jgi:hypothetical protein
MNIVLQVIIIIFVIVEFCLFFLSRLFVPNLGFKRTKLPKELPLEFQRIINRLKKQSKDKEEYAKKLYNELAKRFYGEPGRVLIDLPFVFVKKIKRLWKRRLSHCHQLNYMYRIGLIKSGLFHEKDIKIRHMFCLFQIHQYLKVNIGKVKEKWIYIDLFARTYRYGFGKKIPILFNPFKYWKKRKTSIFGFLAIFSHIFKRILR